MENLKSQAESQLENSLYEACLETLMKILIISEQPELILVKIAQILIHIQKPQSAILALQESIMLDRSSPNLDAINMLANIYSSLNLHDAALVLFKNLFENDKTAISLYTRALVNCKKYYEVILVFRNYQTSDGIPRIELYNDAIFAFMQLDKFVEALELAKLVYESGLYITGIYLAECLLYLDDIDELGHAFEIFEKCVASIEKEKLLLITQQELPLQISFDDLNTSDEEVVVQDLLITINANDKRTSCDKDTKPQPISRPRKIKHQRFVPLSSQQKLTCLRKSQSRAFNGLAKLLMLKGRTEEALSSVSKAFMLSSNDPVIIINFTIILIRLKRKESACMIWRRFVNSSDSKKLHLQVNWIRNELLSSEISG